MSKPKTKLTNKKLVVIILKKEAESILTCLLDTCQGPKDIINTSMGKKKFILRNREWKYGNYCFNEHRLSFLHDSQWKWQVRLNGSSSRKRQPSLHWILMLWGLFVCLFRRQNHTNNETSYHPAQKILLSYSTEC